jgi:4-amino-4-deoxychorismate lyase
MAETDKTPILGADEAIRKLRTTVHARAKNFYAMYSSILGGIVIDPALMVLPFDDHMVHRGHAVFDTATLVSGMLYQLDQHLDRLLRSAEMARISLPFPRAKLRQIILETAAGATARFATGFRPGRGASASGRPNASAAPFTSWSLAPRLTRIHTTRMGSEW